MKAFTFTKYLLICLAFAFVFLSGITKLQDVDIWYHMKAGEYVAQTRSIPHTDVFAVTPGQEWIAHDWLAELGLYGIYKAAGVNGLILVKALLTTAVFLVLTLLVFKLKTDFYAWLAAFLLTAVMLQERMSARPQMFAFLFMAVFLYLLYSYKNDRARYAKYLFLLPLLELVWANVQPSYLVGIVLAWIFAAAELVETRKTSRLTITALVMVPLAFANPFGFGILGVIKEINSPLFSSVAEFNSPFSAIYAGRVTSVLFGAALVLGALSFTRNYKRIDLTNLLLFAAFSALAVKGARYISEFGLIFLPVFCTNLPEEPRPAAGPGTLAAVNGAVALAVCLAGWLVVRNDFGVYRTGLRTFGLGVRENYYPVKAVDFIVENAISGRMYNDTNFGSYLMWRLYPGQKVFIDGRFGSYPTARYIEAYSFYFRPGEYLKKYGIEYCVLSYPTKADITKGLHEYLFRNPDWALVYWDDVALVYLKRSARYADLIGRCGYRLFNPVFDEECLAARAGSKLREEILRAANGGSALSRPHFYLGGLYFRQGTRQGYADAAAEYAQAVRYNPKYALAYLNLGIANLKLGNDSAAKEWLKKGRSCAARGELRLFDDLLGYF